MKYYRVECCGEAGEIVAATPNDARGLWVESVGGECEDPKGCGVTVEELPADDTEVCVWLIDDSQSEVEDARACGVPLRRHPRYPDVWGEVRTRRQWCAVGAEALDDVLELAEATGGGHVTRGYLVWSSVY